MPNRYEREIEEILRNLETTEPKPGLGQRFGERLRRKPDYRVKPPRRSFPSLHLRTSEWFIILAVIAALVAGGYAYARSEYCHRDICHCRCRLSGLDRSFSAQL